MSNPRDVARMLYEHNKSHLPQDASPDVEREWHKLRQQEHDAPFARLRAANADGPGANVAGAIPGLGSLLLLILGIVLWGGAWFTGYVQASNVGATTFLALLLTWLAPPVGIISFGVLAKVYAGGGYIHPYLFIVMIVPLIAVLSPLRTVSWHRFVCSMWRHLFAGVLVFASITKGQLQFLVENQAPAIEQNPDAFWWGAACALIAIILSMIADKIIRMVTAPFAGTPMLQADQWTPFWLLQRLYAVVGAFIYAGGVIALAVFSYKQLFIEDSIVAFWT